MGMAFGLTVVGCQASGQATEGPSVALVMGTPLAAVSVYVHLPVPLSAASDYTTRLLPTPDGGRSDTIGTAPQEQLRVTVVPLLGPAKRLAR